MPSARCGWTCRGPRYDALSGSVTADLLVVGAGYTGLWTALHAAQRNPDQRDRPRRCRTRRVGGVRPQRRLRRRQPDPRPRERKGALAQRNRDTRDDGAGKPRRHAGRYRAAGARRRLAAHRDVVRRDGTASGGLAARRRQTTARGSSSRRARCAPRWRRRRTWRVCSAPTPRPSSIPRKLAFELARACAEAGVRIFERTNVTSMDSSGAAIRFAAGNGTITAGRAVLATNVFPSLIVRNRLQTVPVYDYVLATEPLTDAQLDRIGWVNRQGIGDCANQFHYYRLSYRQPHRVGRLRRRLPLRPQGQAGLRGPARQLSPGSRSISSSPSPNSTTSGSAIAGPAPSTPAPGSARTGGWPVAAGWPTSTGSPGWVSARRGSPPTSASTCSTVGRPRAPNWKWFVSGRCRFRLSRWPASGSRRRDGRSTAPTTRRDGAICCCAHWMRSGSASIPERPLSVCKTFRLGRSEPPTRATQISKLSRVGYGEMTSGRSTAGCRLQKGATT